MVIYFAGTVAIVILICIAAVSLIRSHVLYNKKQKKEKGDPTINKLMKSGDSEEALQLLRLHTRDELSKILTYTEENFTRTVTSFMNESLRGLRKSMGATKFEKGQIKQMKRIGTVAMSRLDNNMVLDKGLYYYQGNDFASELVYSIGRMVEPCLEHIDNNFNPLDEIQKTEFTVVAEKITTFLHRCKEIVEENSYEGLEQDVVMANTLNNELSHLKREELKRIQSQAGSIKVSMIYLTMIQEAQNIVSYTINLLKVSRKFQQE